MPQNLVSEVDSVHALEDMLNYNAQMVPDTSVSIASCDYKCATEQCLDTFKKKVPFAVSMGCIRGNCGCEALDLNQNVY